VARNEHPGGPLRDYGIAMKKKLHQLPVALLILADPACNADSLELGMFSE